MTRILPCVLLLLGYLQASLGGVCEPIKIEACQLWGYNETSMPNLASHVKQADASEEFDTFVPLLETKCSTELPFFLCAVYTPMCAPLAPSFLVGPCRPICETVRRQCEPLMRKLGFSWPKHFDCGRFFPENREHEMCMQGPGEGAPSPRLPLSSLHTFRTNPLFRQRVKEHLSSDSELNHKYKDYVKLLETDLNMRNPATTSSNSECRHLKRSSKYVRVHHLDACVPLCGAPILFDDHQKDFAAIWMSVWSSLCLVSCLFTLGTYFLDTENLKFPERAIIFLTLSYTLHAIGYIFRLLGGRDLLACQPLDGDLDISLLTQEGLRNELCVLNALLLHFPFQAASTWWTMGTFVWCLSCFGLSMERYAPLYHLYAWGIPAGLTVAALVLKKIDASELTGMCSIGNQSLESLLLFVVIPEVVQFGLSLLFFLVGLIVVSLRRKQIYSRIGVFWILYTLPKACVLGCMFYEYDNRGSWMDVTKSDRPNVEIFMLHICMSLVIGVTTAYWIWSKESFNKWKDIGRAILGFWRREKKPSTPTFPTVRYRPQPLGGVCDSKSQGYATQSQGSIEFGRQNSLGSSPVVL